MGRWRGGGARFSAVLVAVGAALLTAAGPAAAASGGGQAVTPPPSVPTTTTLPAIPKVAPVYTNGQEPQTLLSNAISLASLGLDNSMLVKAVAATQAKLDADALAARKYAEQARVAEARASSARQAAADAGDQYASMAGAVKAAVVYLYTAGPASLSISPKAGAAALYAQDYAASTMGPYGVLARRQEVHTERARALATASKEARAAADAAAKSASALARQQRELDQLKAELASAAGATAAQVAADHVVLADQAGKELLDDSALEFTTKTPISAPVSTTSVALTWAFAELGKEYVWGATGPDTFDCSGLTQFVWKAAGVQIPRVAADQDAWTVPVPLSQLLPGDLVFFGTTDIHHVGIYIGNGLMINAPHTGTVVQVSSIWWSDLAGFGRVHYPGTPVPPHDTPTPAQPAAPAVVGTSGPVPSQTKPPAGWTPKPGETTPITLSRPSSPTTTAPAGSESTTTTTTAVSPTTSTLGAGDTTTTSTLPSSVSASGLPPEPASSTTSTTTTTTAGPSTTSTTTVLPPAG